MPTTAAPHTQSPRCCHTIAEGLATRSSQADRWCHLKSMDHALSRALEQGTPVAPLDVDRLRALAELLSDETRETAVSGLDHMSSLLAGETPRTGYLLTASLRRRLQDLPAFRDYSQKSHLGFAAKIDRLAKAIEQYLTAAPGQLFSVPREEFEVLRAMLQVLLRDTHSAVNA